LVIRNKGNKDRYKYSPKAKAVCYTINYYQEYKMKATSPNKRPVYYYLQKQKIRTFLVSIQENKEKGLEQTIYSRSIEAHKVSNTCR